MFYVYAISNQQTGRIYIGQTADLKKRLDRHNHKLPAKASSYTSKNAGEWKYCYIEECKTRSEALKREKQLKSAKGREFIKSLCQ